MAGLRSPLSTLRCHPHGCSMHDSGPLWFARPSVQRTSTTYSLPVLPAHLKNSVSADGPKILALIRRDARVDVEDRKQVLISRPSVLWCFYKRNVIGIFDPTRR